MKLAPLRLIKLYEYLFVPWRFRPSPDQFGSVYIRTQMYMCIVKNTYYIRIRLYAQQLKNMI